MFVHLLYQGTIVTILWAIGPKPQIVLPPKKTSLTRTKTENLIAYRIAYGLFTSRIASELIAE